MSRVGQFVWRESSSTSVDKSLAFYKALFGWTFTEAPMGDFVYSLAHAGGKQVGGIMPMPKMAAGMPSNWMSYVAVDDVDAAVVRCTEAGGKVVMAPHDIPNVGRFSTFQDPTGAYVTAFNSSTPGAAPEAGPPKGGEFCWEQLNTSAPDVAKAFYGKVFGWTTKDFSGGGGVTVFSSPTMDVASMMAAPPGVPSHWLTYVLVGKLGEANAKVTELGGKVLMAEIPVPGMGAFSVVQDPAGATIGLFEARM